MMRWWQRRRAPPEAAWERARRRMVSRQLERRGISDPAVLRAMAGVPRHEFIPETERRRAYADCPLDISLGQTISQPYIVALMTELARVKPGDRVLEIGTGSGYQAAVLSALGAEVRAIELLPQLAGEAEAKLRRLGYGRIRLRIGDGSLGWPEEAPFDAILAAAAPAEIPPALPAQLKPGGRLVIPIGEEEQSLKIATRRPDGLEVRDVIPVRFVPMRRASA